MIQGLKRGMEWGRAKTCTSGGRTTEEPGGMCVCVCVCVHTHEGNYSATQWLARHKDYSSPCEQSQNANRKLDFMSVGVLSSRVVQKLIQVTFEFSFV